MTLTATNVAVSVATYIRFSTLMNVFPEYTIKMNFVTEKEIHTVMKFPVR